MLLTVNMLIQTVQGSEKTVERILWINPDYSMAVVIDIHANRSTPTFKNIEDITQLLEEEKATVLAEDPYSMFVTEEEISEKERLVRDKAWEIIKDIAGKENEPDIFDAKRRGELVKKASANFGVSGKTIYKYLRRYWQRGKHKNALLPDFKNIGGKGNEKKITEKKRGRPRQFKDIVGEGVNVDEETKRIFRIALNKFYLTNNVNSLKIAYELMRKEFFSNGFRTDEDVKKPIIKASCEVPSFGQFKYFFYKERNLKKEISMRKGTKQYLQNHRPLLGSSTSEAIGPGGLYQIDATIADVYLVSRYNRNWIIGRPVVYLCLDVFSRMVVGIYVGLEGPSWTGAMMALANSAMDKVEYCKQYEIQITEEQWPAHHLCDTLVADRGELEGKMAETLIGSLHIKIQNTSPYRADLKGLIERQFRILNDKTVKPFLPGVVKPDFRERGSRDYRLDGVLDLYQFTQIMIKSCLHHNQSWLNSYNREELMVADDVEPIPIKLWNWGIRNRAGKLRSVSEDIVKLNLMPISQAYVSAQGIQFKGMYYASEQAIRERLFEEARINGGWKIDVSYDPRNMNYIYIRKENGKRFEKCYLLDHQERYKDKTMEEIEYLKQYEKLLQKQKEDEVLQSKVDLISEIEAIVQEAEKMTKEQLDGAESKTQKIKGIRKNRQFEKLMNRGVEAFELDKRETGEKGQVVSFTRPPFKDTVQLQEEMEEEIALLRKKQRERTHGNTE